MHLSKEDEEYIRLGLIRAILDLQICLVSIESDLKMLGSKFSPYFHEADTQLDELRQRVEGDKFGNQGN